MIKLTESLLLLARKPTTMIFSIIFISIIDLWTGRDIHFPILYSIPIMLVTWNTNLYAGLTCSVALPLFRLSWFLAEEWTSQPPIVGFLNYSIRVFTFSLIAFLTHHLHRSSQRIKTLEGILPICCVCHQIRTSDNSWKQMESYISEHSDAQFSHSYCPTCQKKLLEEVEQIRAAKRLSKP